MRETGHGQRYLGSNVCEIASSFRVLPLQLIAKVPYVFFPSKAPSISPHTSPHGFLFGWKPVHGLSLFRSWSRRKYHFAPNRAQACTHRQEALGGCCIFSAVCKFNHKKQMLEPNSFFMAPWVVYPTHSCSPLPRGQRPGLQFQHKHFWHFYANIQEAPESNGTG